MEEETPANHGGAKLYIDLGERATPASAQFLEVIKNLLVQLRNSNERFLKASEEQEKMIRGMTKKSSDKTMELEVEKTWKEGNEVKPPESGGESNKIYPLNRRKNKQVELHGEF